VLEAARQAHAKVVLVGDPEQLQAIEAGAAFRGIAAQHGVVELAQVRRQRLEWQRAATAELASGKTKDALAAYGEHQGIVAVDERAQARTALLARWAHDAKLEPEGSQLVLAYTRADVKELNTSIRTLRQQTGQLGETHEIATSQGRKAFSVRDRVRFMRNERSMGVRNGSLGTVEGIEGGVLSIRLDGAEKALQVDTKFYPHLDHGYAATVHKAQGMTVDRTYVLATPHFDRHTTYVAMSRHREAATMWYAREDFGGRDQRLDGEQVHARFTDRLARQQSKDLAHDYLERAFGAGERAVAEVVRAPEAVKTIEATPAPARKQTLEEIRAAAREQWQQEYGGGRGAASAEELRRQAVEEWLALRAERADSVAAPAVSREQERGAGLELSFGGEDREDRERALRLTTQELRQEIQDRRPEPVSRLVEQDPAVQAAVRAAAERRERFQQAQRRERQAQQEAQAWRQAHAVKAKLHDLGVASADFLVTRAATEVEARGERLTAFASQEQIELELERARAAAAARIAIETAPERARIAQLERLLGEKARAERLTREFKELAQQHALQEPGTPHRSAEWQATPEVLREAIEQFNQLPTEAREESLQALVAEPEMTRTLGQALAQRHERLRNLDRGLDQGLEL
jgi:hypothetical protein